MTQPTDVSTRDRLKAAALELLTERGYRETTVGEIEARAGLTRRGGGFYRHFKSKQHVLEAVLEDHLKQLGTTQNVMDLMPLGDVRAEITLLARFGLQQIQSMRPFVRILQRDAKYVPGLLDRYRDEVVRHGYAIAADWFRRQFKDASLPDRDFEALAVMAVGSVINYRWEEALFGLAPADLDDERFVQAFVDVWTNYFSGLAADPPV
jgi:AcrR family transcriptional regulator